MAGHGFVNHARVQIHRRVGRGEALGGHQPEQAVADEADQHAEGDRGPGAEAVLDQTRRDVAEVA